MVSGRALARQAARLSAPGSRVLTAEEVFGAQLRRAVAGPPGQRVRHRAGLPRGQPGHRARPGPDRRRRRHGQVLGPASARPGAARWTPATPFPPELVPARFPDDAPLLGAVALAVDAAAAIPARASADRRSADSDGHPQRQCHSQRRPERQPTQQPHPERHRQRQHRHRRGPRTPPSRNTHRKASVMRRLTAIGSLITAGLLAAACSAGAGPSGNGTAAAKNVVTISNENGALWTCQFSPFNGSDTLLSVGFVYETLAYDNPLQSGKTTPMLASLLAVGRGQQVDHLHHPQGRQVQRRHPDVGRRRGVHLQPAQEVPGPGPDRRLVGAVQRDPVRFRPGGHGLQVGRRARVLLHRRADPDRARAHLVEDRQPGHLRRHQPDRHRPVRGEPVRQGEHHLHGQPALLAAGRAADRQGRVPGLHQQQHGQRPAGQRPGPVGRAVHPEPSRPSTRPRAPTSTTGSRRR